MANEYAVNSADLTSVANAIREKGKTSGQLVFPSGFVTAIQNMKGGGDLNFEVVGGTTQPSSPKQNTIWINTDTEITGWVFSVTEPSTPIPGMVWFETGTESDVSFDAIGDDNELRVYPISANQYISGSWVSVDAQSYLNGEWAKWATYLYKSGNEYTDITGGWSAKAWKYNSVYTAKAPTLTKNANNMVFELSKSSSAGHSGAIHIANDIDLTRYKKLTAVISSATATGSFPSSSGNAWVVCLSVISRNATHFRTDAVGYSTKSYSDNDKAVSDMILEIPLGDEIAGYFDVVLGVALYSSGSSASVTLTIEKVELS